MSESAAMITDPDPDPALPATPHSAKHIVLAHGGGGMLTDQLLREQIVPRLDNPVLRELGDAAVLAPCWQDRPAMTIDSYVIQPWRFPGGDIGRLSVCGTVNDLAVAGAVPRGIALSLIIAEGFAKKDLDAVLDSIAKTAEEAGVPIVTGDTKVVGRDQADDIYITTAGFGTKRFTCRLGPRFVQPGDVLIVNGPIGEHGLAVMLEREMPEVQSVLRSDVAPLNGLIAALLRHVPGVVFMRDPTRAGLAGVAVDLAAQSGWHVTLDESAIPVRPEARHAADMLGLDPLEVANEGKVVIAVRGADVGNALDVLRSHELGREADVIGRVEATHDGLCELHTTIGGRRIVQKPYGEQLPRIC